MDTPKPSRRKAAPKKIEPIDWHEFANDAVLQGNMSTLYRRPPSEDPSAYASAEALAEISKRTPHVPTVGNTPTVGDVPTVGITERDCQAAAPVPTVGPIPPAGMIPTVGMTVQTRGKLRAESSTTVGSEPTKGIEPTVGTMLKPKVKPIREFQDGLTLAGQVLYQAMYGASDSARSKSCMKGYRQLAAETHLDKDTVRDLISEFKDKGIVREVATYDPDTRSAKTYEVLSHKAILQAWRDAGLMFVTTGRKRPMFCTALGVPSPFTPIVGIDHTVGPAPAAVQVARIIPTVGNVPTVSTEAPHIAGLMQTLQQITAIPVDQEAADRLIADCRAEAGDCTIEEIVELAWSKAFLCRSGRIEDPIGFLITQVPKHFQKEALQTYRNNKRRELETAAGPAGRESERRRESEGE